MKHFCGPYALAWLLHEDIEVIYKRIRRMRRCDKNKAITTTSITELARIATALGHKNELKCMRELEGKTKSFGFWNEWYRRGDSRYLVRWGNHFVAVTKRDVFDTVNELISLSYAVKKYKRNLVSHFIEFKCSTLPMIPNKPPTNGRTD
jgi:hypothetical protein